jgi:thioesterase domain-containing protein
MSDLRDQIGRLTPEQRARLEQRLRAGRQSRAGIGPRPAGSPARLSFGQERVWRLERLMGDTAAYNIHACHRLRGVVDVEALRAALEAVVGHNETLRTVFSGDGGRPITSAREPFELMVTDLSTDLAPLARVAKWAERPLDTVAGPLFAARLWRLGPDHHLLSLLAHHLVCDGWSMSLIERQLSEAYRGGRIESGAARLDYADFVAWEASREAELRTRLDYWSSTLDGVSALRLPGERGADAGDADVDLSVATSAAIDDLARRARATPFSVLLAVFAMTLNRHTGQEDLVVCSPVAGRPDPALESIVGYFNDLVPIRGQLTGDPDLLTLIDRYRPAILDAVEHSVPFQWIATLPETNATPLTHALFALNDVPTTGLQLPRLTVEPVEVPSVSSDFELGWYMRAEEGRYRASIRYRSATAASVEALATDFATFAKTLTTYPGTRLSELPQRRTGEPSTTDARPTAAPTQPRSLLESRLQRIWERVFSRPVGVDDDFFDLGGHSLLAAELIAEIERELSKERIPLATLFSAPTVASFAHLLEVGGWRRSWKSLVPIKPTGDRLPLFFVHAHGGNVIGYADLARHLSPEQPLYGLQAPRMDVDGGRRRIEEMARTYIDEIRSVQPSGPYLVGGYCLGGTVAFEMAHQLRAEGAEVGLVLIVDNVRREQVRITATSPLQRISSRIGTRYLIEWSNLAEVPWRDKGRYLATRTARLLRRLGSAVERLFTDRSGRLPFGLEHSRTFRQEELDEVHEKAYEEYRPRPYSGAVAVFRAARQPLGREIDATLGWSSLVDGDLTVYELPGHRIGLFSEPRVQRVVPIMETAIRDALDPRRKAEP